MIIMFQYSELPYGKVLSSLISAGKHFPTGDSSENPQNFGNITHFDDSHFTATSGVHESSNITIFKGSNESVGNDFISEQNRGSDYSAEEMDGESEDPFLSENLGLNHNSTLKKNRISDAGPAGSLFASPPKSAPLPSTLPIKVNSSLSAPAISLNPNTSSPDKDEPNSIPNHEESTASHSDIIASHNNTSSTEVTPVEEGHETPMGEVVSLSQMNDIFVRSRASSRSMRPLWSSTVDQELVNAKSQIENAPISKNDRGVYASLYRNVSMFRRSYELMEQTLKVYIYKEGKKPIFHQPVLKGIYASEGWFMRLLKANKQFVTKSPKKAHLFYIPFSSRMLEETLYVTGSHSRKNLVQYLKNYLDMVVVRYPFWNRTGGADHFLVACHDWAPAETKEYMGNCIRALCNADVKEGFKLGKDVSLPETMVRSAMNPLRELGGKPPSERSVLAFFAGSMHGYLRPILLQHWQNKDLDMNIFGKLPKSKNNRNYVQYMKSSKYCICAKGYEVNSPRVVEAIFYECVPVIISDNFVPPFFEVLNWESFAVFVQEKDIPNLKKILLSISERRYLLMQQRVKQVQQHFLWHVKPVKYDIFHMILHSIWYNRVFQITPR